MLVYAYAIVHMNFNTFHHVIQTQLLTLIYVFFFFIVKIKRKYFYYHIPYIERQSIKLFSAGHNYNKLTIKYRPYSKVFTIPKVKLKRI